MGTPAFHSHCCIKIHFALRKQINLWHEMFDNIFVEGNPHYSCDKNTILLQVADSLVIYEKYIKIEFI